MNVHRLDVEEFDLFISAEGDWRGFRSGACAKEPETAAWIRRVAGDGKTFFDIGACVGSYSLIAAKFGSNVHAFEPVAANYSQLQLNTWLNRPISVSVWPIACTGNKGPLEIQLSSTIPGTASHLVSQTPPHRPGYEPDRPVQRAVGIPLDEFVEQFTLERPTDIKLDVDGGEIDALEGARETLRSVKSVMVEVSNTTAASVSAILQAAGLEQTGEWARSGGQSNHLFERHNRD